MNIALWIAQIVLGGMFTMAGVIKSFQPIDKMAPKMAWVTRFSPAMVRFVGISELLGGIGVILPTATGIAPWLVVPAALGLGLTQVLAFIHHVKYNEVKPALPINSFLLLLSLFVAVGRFFN